MADISYTNDATERRANTGLVLGKGEAGSPKVVVSTIELAASASGTTVKLARLPSNARILPMSTIYADDLATSGSPTLDIGVGSVDSNVTSDPDGLNDGIDISTGSTTRMVKEIANSGLPLWDFVSGQSEDPGGLLDVYASVKDAATNAAGTITAEIAYVLD